jgi:hypothetical protein
MRSKREKRGRVKVRRERPRPCGRCGILTKQEASRLRLFYGYVCSFCAADCPPDIDTLAAGLNLLIVEPPPLTIRRY